LCSSEKLSHSKGDGFTNLIKAKMVNRQDFFKKTIFGLKKAILVVGLKVILDFVTLKIQSKFILISFLAVIFTL